MLDRVIRVISAIDCRAKARDGRIMDEKVSNPEEGSHPNCTEKNRIIRSPSQKMGMETPTMAKNITKESKKEYYFTTDMIPKGTPRQTDRMTAMVTSFTVAGNAASTSCATGFFVT